MMGHDREYWDAVRRTTNPILPDEWHQTTVTVAFVDSDIPPERGTLLDANPTGLLLDVGDGQRFFAWCAVRFVGVDRAPRAVGRG